MRMGMRAMVSLWRIPEDTEIFTRSEETRMQPTTKTTRPTDTLNDNNVEHPIGAGVGAVGGGVIGASIGMAAGPLGMAAGAAIGAALGTVTGEAVTESLDFSKDDDAYWRGTHTTRPYVQPSDTYESYRPAYQYGATAYKSHTGKRYEDVRSHIQSDWEKNQANANLGWEKAEPAIRESYQYYGARTDSAKRPM